jgi:hypothetical protein
MKRRVKNFNFLEEARQTIAARPEKITVATIAAECQVSRTWVYDLIRGKDRDFGARKLQEICEFINDRS